MIRYQENVCPTICSKIRNQEQTNSNSNNNKRKQTLFIKWICVYVSAMCLFSFSDSSQIVEVFVVVGFSYHLSILIFIDFMPLLDWYEEENTHKNQPKITLNAYRLTMIIVRCWLKYNAMQYNVKAVFLFSNVTQIWTIH